MFPAKSTKPSSNRISWSAAVRQFSRDMLFPIHDGNFSLLSLSLSAVMDCLKQMVEGMWFTKVRGAKHMIRFVKYDAEVSSHLSLLTFSKEHWLGLRSPRSSVLVRMNFDSCYFHFSSCLLAFTLKHVSSNQHRSQSRSRQVRKRFSSQVLCRCLPFCII